MVVQDLRKVYFQKGSGQAVVSIDALSFSVHKGEVVAIVGRTGCGKSTFFNLLMGVERPTQGSIRIEGLSPHEDFHAFKGRIGVVFQQDRLLPWRTVFDNVRLGLEILKVPEAEQHNIARSWLERLGLQKFMAAYPNELSGGMRQRVAIARTFAIQPQLLLADEAFGHLDEVTAADLRGEFLRLVESQGSTTLFITHQLEEALSVAKRVLVFGRPARLLADISTRGLGEVGIAGLRREIQAMLDSNQSVEPVAHS